MSNPFMKDGFQRNWRHEIFKMILRIYSQGHLETSGEWWWQRESQIIISLWGLRDERNTFVFLETFVLVSRLRVIHLFVFVCFICFLKSMSKMVYPSGTHSLRYICIYQESCAAQVTSEKLASFPFQLRFFWVGGGGMSIMSDLIQLKRK